MQILQYLQLEKMWTDLGVGLDRDFSLVFDYLYLSPEKSGGWIFGWKVFMYNTDGVRISTDGSAINLDNQGNVKSSIQTTYDGKVEIKSGVGVLYNDAESIPYNIDWGSTGNIIIGAMKTDGNAKVDYMLVGKMTIKINDTITAEIYPALDDNNRTCFWNATDNTFHYSMSGTDFIAGPVAHIFNPDTNSVRIDQTGGVATVNVEAETTWDIAYDTDWFTVVKNDDSVTISAPVNETDQRKEMDITFTDADGYSFVVKVKQKGITQGMPLHLGELEIPTLMLGDKEVTAAYLGEQQVFSI